MWMRQGKGRMHDFKLFKRDFKGICRYILLIGDSGFQGIYDLHKNSMIPFKRTKNHPLTAEEKAFNRELSKIRIAIEHVNRRIKRFRMFSGRYRNKRKKYGLRMSLTCGIHNFETRNAKLKPKLKPKLDKVA